MLFSYPPDTISAKKASVSILSLSRKEIRRDYKALSLLILHSYTGIYLSVTIIPTLLCTSIGRSQYPLSIIGEAVKRWAGRSDDPRTRRGCITSDIALSACRKASGRLIDWHIPGLSRYPTSQLLILQLVQSNKCARQSLVWSCRLKSVLGHTIKADTICATVRGKLTRTLLTYHSPVAPGHS
jgi:hypothetical protein